MLKLKLQHFGHMMQRAESLEKFLVLEKTELRRRRGSQRMRWQDGTTEAMDMYLGRLQRWRGRGRPVALQSMGCKESGMTGQLSNNTNDLTLATL